VWQYKRPALKIMQLKTDGPFRTGRKWYSQFYASPEEAEKIRGTGRKWYSQFYTSPEEAEKIRGELNGVHHTQGMATPAEANHNIDGDLQYRRRPAFLGHGEIQACHYAPIWSIVAR
jgi:3-ketosteroid 9alpha-monooxygenase subunit A